MIRVSDPSPAATGLAPTGPVDPTVLRLNYVDRENVNVGQNRYVGTKVFQRQVLQLLRHQAKTWKRSHQFKINSTFYM